jgi:exopolysaccharide biosynthesis polyprenyl glycosylphosphotransferase
MGPIERELREPKLNESTEPQPLNGSNGSASLADWAGTEGGRISRESRGRRYGWPGRWWRDSLRRRTLALADLLAVVIAAVLFLPSGVAVLWSITFLPVWILFAKAVGNYDRDHRSIRHLTIDELPQLIAWAALGSLVLTGYLSVTPAGEMSGSVTTQVFLAVGVGVIALRAIVRWSWRGVAPAEQVAVIGSGAEAASTERKLVMARGMKVNLSRTIDPPAPEMTSRERSEWFRAVTAGIDRIILAPGQVSDDLIADLRILCREQQVKLTAVSSLRGRARPASRMIEVADMPMLEFDTWDISRSTVAMKRIFDVALSASLLILTAPLFVLIPIAIKLESRGPVFFSQLRAGEWGEPFRMLKFRTMRAGADAQLPKVVRLDELEEPMFKLRDDPRVTRVGRVLRRVSLDELPQLLNVLRGQMSIVGPRPEEIEMVKRYKPEHRFRLAVKPGMTGPMQVNGRANLTFAERLALELNYIENLSLGRDLRLLTLTASAVVRRDGAY